MMLHPYFSQYRALMLAERQRRARARLHVLSSVALGVLSGIALIYSGWPF